MELREEGFAREVKRRIREWRLCHPDANMDEYTARYYDSYKMNLYHIKTRMVVLEVSYEGK